MRGFLALADGTIFEGRAFGAIKSIDQPATGEVVFNTSIFGYQEILTDPSYAGQIMTFTNPQIGNVGCNIEDDESNQVHVRGMLIKEYSPIKSNFRATETLEEYLIRNNIMGLEKFDTRALVRYIRDNGAQMGAMAAGERSICQDLIKAAKAEGSMLGKNFVPEVSTKITYSWRELPWQLGVGYTKLDEKQVANYPHLVVIDCGIKRNILRLLAALKFKITVVNVDITKEQLLKLNPDAIFLSNGPGDPATLAELVKTVKAVLGTVPIFGICLGHQILAQALGANTYKLKFGHRGGNHPVIDLKTRKVEITVQNHGFAVTKESLQKEYVTHLNLNDHTIEGLAVPELKVFSVQYHPESSPGPHDSQYLFNRFATLVSTGSYA